MELQALLTSNILPNDIVCHEIYNHLWRNRNLLNTAQTDAIVYDHFHMKKILNFYHTSENLSKNSESDYYFLVWLENDLISCLNDHLPLIDGLSPLLKAECPDMTVARLLECESIEKLPEKIYFLWKNMTYQKRSYFYQMCVQ